jgi:sugar-specific transcriptional regulator TrmB
VSLGFTPLEARVYTFLLRESPVTGYRVAQALRKPAPNIYKAIESLEVKGAVLVDEGQNRLCHPVPPDELLAHLERRFRERSGRAASLLADVSAAGGDDRVYSLRSADQVRERARRMLGRAEEVALVDAFPVPIAELAPDLEAAAARGVLVAAKAYEPVEIDGVLVVPDPRRRAAAERWPGQWMNLVVDGSEHLVAFLTEDGTGVHQAVWSGSVYLSWVYHSAVSSEITLDAVKNRIDEGGTLEELDALVGELDRLKAFDAPGYRELSRRLARRPSDEGGSAR